MDTFNNALVFLFEHEGGTNTDPDDRGGYTKYGISSKTYPDLDISNITEGRAKTIYYNDFWLPNAAPLSSSPALQVVMFDTSVNCGVGSACVWLQESLRSFGSVLNVDGVMGPITIDAANQVDPRRLIDGIIARMLKQKNQRVIKSIHGAPYLNKFIRMA